MKSCFICEVIFLFGLFFFKSVLASVVCQDFTAFFLYSSCLATNTVALELYDSSLIFFGLVFCLNSCLVGWEGFGLCS